MAQHTIELRQKQGFDGNGWEVDLPQQLILVDGRYVGYCSTKPHGGLHIGGRIPDAVRDLVEAKVAEYWETETAAVHAQQLNAAGDDADPDADIELGDEPGGEDRADDDPDAAD